MSQNESVQEMQSERAASIGGSFSESMEMECEKSDMCQMDEDDDCEYNMMQHEEKFREAGAKVYQQLESTCEYIEKEYYFDHGVQFTSNSLYFSFGEHILKTSGSVKNFMDKNFLYCTSSVTEMIFIMSIMDLEFDSKPLTEDLKTPQLKLTAQQNCIILSREISEVKGTPLDLDFLISQRFYDPLDRYQYLEDDTKVEKPVQEFIRGKVYGCRVVVTNSTVSDQNVSLITEIPQGAIALQPGESLKVHSMQLNSFQSEVRDMTFYFPKEGKYTVYPATIAKQDSILATAKQGVEIEVKLKKEHVVLDSISDVLSTGNMSNIIDFLKTKNLKNSSVYQFKDIGWLMKNKEFYSQVIEIFRTKGVYSPQIWQFCIYHNDLQAFKEISNSDKVMSILKNFFFLETSFVKVDNCKAKDYFPLINPRAHCLGDKEANIMNKQFRDTYKNFLLYLVEKGKINAEDSIMWVTYLLLQDRVFEANTMFNSLSNTQKDQVETKIQCDYIEAYIDFMTGFPDFTKATKICQEYLDYPILGWRNLFVEIANQLSEYQELEQSDTQLLEQNKLSKQAHADLSPYLSAVIDKSNIKVSIRNQNKIYLEFYQIDIEVLFTQDPFETQLNSSLTNVLPFLSESHTVENKSDFQSINFEVPKNLQNLNLLIRVVDPTKQSVLLKYIPFHLEAVLNETYGILKLIDSSSNRPVPKIYVKCFAKMKNGNIRFFKDGYTDLRGSFDYASMNTSGATQASMFRLLVCSPSIGSKILEATPPISSLRTEGKAKKIKGQRFRGLKKKKGKKAMQYQLSDYEE